MARPYRLGRIQTIAIGLSTLLAAANSAAAQPRGALSPTRVVISVSGGLQGGAPSLSEHFTFDRDQEVQTVDVEYPSKSAALVDVGASVRVWKSLGLGVAVSRATGNGTAEVESSVPHPFQFNQPRAISGTEEGIVHAETGVHLQLQYLVPTSGRVHLTLSAGPTWLNLEQEAVTDVTVSQSYPYDTAAFGGAVTKILKTSATGFHAGFDVTWMFSRSAGVGGLVRYTRADMDLTVAEGRTLAVKAGGIQGGLGLRIAF
jgi:hypothetical protein